MAQPVKRFGVLVTLLGSRNAIVHVCAGLIFQSKYYPGQGAGNLDRDSEMASHGVTADFFSSDHRGLPAVGSYSLFLNLAVFW